MPAENIILEWNAKEFEQYEKGTGWYLTLALLTVLVVGYFLFLKDYFAALTMLVMYAVIFYFSKHQPKDVVIRITTKGIRIDKLFYAYSSVHNFWIVNHDQAKTLHFETTAYLNRSIIVQLADQDPELIRDVLAEYIPENGANANRESFAVRVARKLKF